MNKKITLSIFLCICTAGYLSWWFSANNVIQRRSEAFLNCIRMDKDTVRNQRAHKAEMLGEIISDTVSITYPKIKYTYFNGNADGEAIILDKARVKSALLYLTEMAEWIHIENEMIEILTKDAKSAKVRMSFDLSSKLKGRKIQNASLTGIFNFTYEQKKWLISETIFE